MRIKNSRAFASPGNPALALYSLLQHSLFSQLCIVFLEWEVAEQKEMLGSALLPLYV